MESIIRPSLLSDESRRSLKNAYTASTPYPHCVIPDICNPDLLRRVRDEIIENVEATYKETDLFKMLQTGDLANMDKLDSESAAKLPTVRALRDAIYSLKFRQFISDVTGCGDLSDKTDCACNIHPFGGHLLCHDDVIGDRRISYIIYLTDPDDAWKAEDGGALELYPEVQGAPNTPDIIPTTTALPTWNTMAMFQVLPGRSFHSIQEVFTSEKPRMSIQGWFHAPVPPTDAARATLSQLQAHPGEDDVVDKFTPFHQPCPPSPDAPLSPEDLSVLSSWLNPVYLNADDKGVQKIRACFKEDGSVQLHNFLSAEKASVIAQAIAAADAADALGGGHMPRYTAGIEVEKDKEGGWEAVGPCHKQRYLRFTGTFNSSTTTTTAAGTAGSLLQRIQTELFSSPAFARFINKLIDIPLTHYRTEVRRFRPGLDYTVAHYGCVTLDPRLDAVLCFVSSSEEGMAQAWECGEMGGYEAYVLADEGEDKPAEVYRGGGDEEGGGVLNVGPSFNCLSLVLRDEGLMRFVKYLSAQAPGSRWDVSGVYVPEDDSDDDDNDD